ADVARSSCHAKKGEAQEQVIASSGTYTLRGQDWHIFKLLELMDEQGGGVMLVNGGHLVEAIVDGVLELLEGVKPGGVQGLLADEGPQALHEVEVSRVRGQEQHADPQLSRQRLHKLAALIAAVLQPHRDGALQPGSGQGMQQGANGVRR